jgi:hypothetical protein
MTKNLRVLFAVSIAAISLLPGSVFAQSSKQPPPSAPAPQRILAAKRIFVANAGEDERSTTGPLYDGGPTRAYDTFYAALKSWGHYELVSDPADADLVLELDFNLERPVIKGESLTSSELDPVFHLAIRDPKTNVLLWRFTEHSQWALLQGNRDKNFDSALAKTVGDLQTLAMEGAGPGNPAKQ